MAIWSLAFHYATFLELRSRLVGYLTLASLLFMLTYEVVEQYPGIVTKPSVVKGYTALSVGVKIVTVGGCALGGDYFQLRHRRMLQVSSGLLCAVAHLGQCLLVCHLVDGAIPTDSAGVFNLLARCISEGLLVVAMVLAWTPPRLGIFDAPGDICEGFWAAKQFRILTVEELKTLVETLVKRTATSHVQRLIPQRRTYTSTET